MKIKRTKIGLAIISLFLVSMLLVGVVSASTVGIASDKTVFIKSITTIGSTMTTTIHLTNMNVSDTFNFTTNAINETVTWDYDNSVIDENETIPILFQIVTTGEVPINQTQFSITIFSVTNNDSTLITVYVGTEGMFNYWLPVGVLIFVVFAIVIVGVGIIARIKKGL